jgi:hypothetical protein
MLREQLSNFTWWTTASISIYATKPISVAITLTISLPVAGQSDAITPGDSLYVDGIPKIPASLAQKVDRYASAYGFRLAGWDHTNREVLLKNLAGSETWILRGMAGGSPKLLMLIPTGVYDVYYQPQAKYVIYNKDADYVRQRKGGAFLQHRKKEHFILAIESGRHTDPNTGASFRTFAVWRPEAPRTDYINEAELTKLYHAVTPEQARDWWMRKYATIPPIQTLETHIIGGAIIPLWQRLKTDRETRLRVVRVSTDEGQRIVGIQIPPDRVFAVLRSLGLTRRLVEPSQIYNAVLNEGEEMTLAANLKLKQANLHGEQVIELHVTDPNKFAQLRELGLINEQIQWKQRFFIPADESRGVEILAALLKTYPVIVTEDEAEDTQEQPIDEIQAMPEANPINVIELEQWIIAAGEIDARTEQKAEASQDETSTVGTASVQSSLLQDSDTEAEKDTRDVREQQSLFSEPLPSNGPMPQASKRKPKGWSYQAQLAFNFSDNEPRPGENLGAASQAA